MENIKHSQHTILKDLISSFKNGNTYNLRGLLEILNTNTDVDVKVKLFSILSAYIMLNDANIDVLVTYNPLYNTICNILTNCPPRKITVTLNFLSALLYCDEETSHRKHSLVVYARNMIRSSGCLATMCELFTSYMMHQDAWRALCRCLAETCRGVEANQSYCTHLVPMCVQRCSQRNVEVLLVLQSLLQNHDRNINLFIESNGIYLFKRELLQYDACLQLLATIAQSSTRAVAVIVNTNICQQLRDFLNLYGSESQLGQWATIILYHTSRVEAAFVGQKSKRKSFEYDDDMKIDKEHESMYVKMRPVNQISDLEGSADTTKFFQNVINEIMQCDGQKEFKNIAGLFPTDNMINRSQRNIINITSGCPILEMPQRNKVWNMARNVNILYPKPSKPKIIENESVHFDKTHELSLSFLRKQNLNKKLTTNDKLLTNSQRTSRAFLTSQSYITKSTFYNTCKENHENCLNTEDTVEFEPKFVSTPKKSSLNETCMQHSQISRNNTRISVRDHKIKRRRRIEKKRVTKHTEQDEIGKEIKHRSMSGRLFDVINTSCTTLVKTVKNIFRPKTDLHETKVKDSSNKTSNLNSSFCNYSFTNYMHKRDAILKSDCINKSYYEPDEFQMKSKESFQDFSTEITNSCNTCNDTISLKRKLAHDDLLKQTVRRLKLGINLYGCDFKKISRQFWPKKSYMSPAVLYNLYRKLIIK